MRRLHQPRERWFQALWMGLHLVAAMMHVGSALYHAQRAREGPLEPSPMPIPVD